MTDAWRRRDWLRAAGAAPLAALGGCAPAAEVPLQGGWVGAAVERGHLLRDAPNAPASVQQRADVIVVGAGVAGLAAARALARAGIDDVRVIDLEDEPGGNSRGHTLAGMACPLGAHYLPVPGEPATEVIELLEDLGLRRTERGRVVYDERHLCHSPQERLFIDGHWHDGLLPPVEALPVAQRASTLGQYRRFAAAVAEAGQGHAFTLPTARARWTEAHAALDALSFAQWLDAQGLDAPALRWYLDYCCRDDYGAGAAMVSAWAGLHYFASRHGFRAPGDDGRDEHDAVLTWPEGNAWLTRRVAAPLQQRLLTGRVVTRVDAGRHDVGVVLWNVAEQRAEQWTARQVVLAVPLFIAARMLSSPPPALTQAAAQTPHAPWLVANLQLTRPLLDRPGAPPSWDNVAYGSAALGALGYVDAMHQSMRPFAGPTVLTAYWALGGDTTPQLRSQRTALLAEPWTAWARRVVDEIAAVHPDLHARLGRVDLMRYGHAMAIPAPGVRGSAALSALAQPAGRVHFAHSDLSGYSVFEEAWFHGCRAAAAVRAALKA